MKIIFIAATILLTAASAWAGKAVDYKGDGATMEGYLAEPANGKGLRPAILIVHDWMGQSDFTKAKADQLAKEGYVAFSADIYGKGNLPKDQKEAAALAGKYKNDTKALRARVTAALETLKKQKNVDPKKVVAMGYCFGGTTVVELARTGTPIAGVATFHGGLIPNAADAKNIKAKMIIMHGAIDPYVPAKDVDAFLKELNDAKVDYEFIAYSGAVHAFTIPAAGNDPSKGAAYNSEADHRSWGNFEQFLHEVAPL